MGPHFLHKTNLRKAA